jgi:hypothetical protein
MMLLHQKISVNGSACEGSLTNSDFFLFGADVLHLL